MNTICMFQKLLLALIFIFISSRGLHAATLLGWDISGDNSPATTTADIVESNLDLTAGLNTLTRTGLTLTSANNSFNSNNWNITNTFDENNKYLSFSLLPSSGYKLTIESLSYVVNGSNTAPGTGRWGFRVGNSGSFTLQNTFAMTFALPTSAAIWDFADFEATESVEFRFWVYGTSSINLSTSATGGAARIGNIAGNDLVLNGSVTVIPEPSASMLVLAGLFGVAGIRLLGRTRK